MGRWMDRDYPLSRFAEHKRSCRSCRRYSRIAGVDPMSCPAENPPEWWDELELEVQQRRAAER